MRLIILSKTETSIRGRLIIRGAGRRGQRGKKGAQNWVFITLYVLGWGALSDDFVLGPVKAVSSPAFYSYLLM